MLLLPYLEDLCVTFPGPPLTQMMNLPLSLEDNNGLTGFRLVVQLIQVKPLIGLM